MNRPSTTLVVMLASLALLALGIYGPGIATGLVSGAPQLGAGAMAGAAVGAVGTGVAIGAAATGVAVPSPPGRAWHPPPRSWPALARAATSAAGSAKSAFQAGSAAAGGARATAGLGNVAKTGAQAAGRRAASVLPLPGRRWPIPSVPDGTVQRPALPAPGASTGEAADNAASSQKQEQPAWAKRMHRRQQITHAATTAAHTLRGGDGSGQGPSLRDSDT